MLIQPHVNSSIVVIIIWTTLVLFVGTSTFLIVKIPCFSHITSGLCKCAFVQKLMLKWPTFCCVCLCSSVDNAFRTQRSHTTCCIYTDYHLSYPSIIRYLCIHITLCIMGIYAPSYLTNLACSAQNKRNTIRNKNILVFS